MAKIIRQRKPMIGKWGSIATIKRLIVFALPIVCLVAFSGYTRAVFAAPSDALVGYWKFDEGSGTSAADSSGLGHTGTLTNMNGTTDWVTERPILEVANLYALDFDGINDYVNMGIDAYGLGIRQHATFSAWVRPDTTTDSRTIMADWQSTTGGFSIRLNTSNTITFFVYPNNHRITTVATLTLNEWNHVAGVMDGANMYVYLNGTQVGTTTLGENIGDDVGTIKIGSRGDAISYMNGQIDDVRIYDEALSPSEIDTLANGDKVLGVTVAETSVPTAVTEGGTTDSYTVVLNTQPDSDVHITVSSSNPSSGATVSSSLLTFTTANWSTPQTITVTAVDDDQREGDHAVTITHTASSSDADYNGIAVSNIAVNITDDETYSYQLSLLDRSADLGTANSQGVAFDGTHYYYTDSTTIYKYTRNSNTGAYTLVTSRNVSGDDPVAKTQVNSMNYHNGYLWIGANNHDQTPRRGWVVQYNPSDLSHVATYVVENRFSEGGAWHNVGQGDEFWAVFTDWDHVARYRIENGAFVKVDDYLLPLVEGETDAAVYQGAAWYGDVLITQTHNVNDNTATHFHRWTGSGFEAIQIIPALGTDIGQGLHWETVGEVMLFTEREDNDSNGQTIVRAAFTDFALNAPAITSSNTNTHCCGPVMAGATKLSLRTLSKGVKRSVDKNNKITFDVPLNTSTVFAAKPVDADQLHTLTLRINGKTYRLTDSDRDLMYTVTIPALVEIGRYPYALTADYGITTYTERGVFVVGGGRDAFPLSELNYLFRLVFGRDPTFAEWEHWVARRQDKPERLQFLGAMQYHRLFAN